MTYKVFEKKQARIGHPAVTINPVGRIYFNQEATEWLRAKRASTVLLLWSDETLTVAIKKAKSNDSRAYRLAYNYRGGGSGITAKSFMNWIGLDSEGGSVSAEAYLSEGPILMEFEIPAENILE